MDKDKDFDLPFKKITAHFEVGQKSKKIINFVT